MTKWITFDNYGTLTQWLDGMRAALASAGVADEDVDRLLLAYHAEEFTLESGEYLPYRDVLRTGLRKAAELTGIALPEGGENAFLDHWDELPVYPDVVEGLTALREDGWRLVVLTNCDNDLWERSRNNIPFDFDGWVTAEDVKSYKPDLGHFRAFRDSIADDDIWIHAAASWLHDVYPAARLGVPRIWVDRDLTGHPPAFADRRIEDIASLPAAVADLLPTLAPVSVSHVKSPLQ